MTVHPLCTLVILALGEATSISVIPDSFGICFFYQRGLDCLASRYRVLKAWSWNGEDKLKALATGMVRPRWVRER